MHGNIRPSDLGTRRLRSGAHPRAELGIVSQRWLIGRQQLLDGGASLLPRGSTERHKVVQRRLRTVVVHQKFRGFV